MKQFAGVTNGQNMEGRRVAIHLLKTFPPCHLNSDESGSMKSLTFGGSTRNMISAQCLRRTIRKSQIIAKIGTIGIRSRILPSEVLNVLRRMQENDKDFAAVDEAFLLEAAQKVTKLGSNGKNKDASGDDEKKASKKERLITSQTMYYTDKDIQTLAEILRKEIMKAKNFEEFKKLTLDLNKIPAMSRLEENPISMDMAFFGRMVTCEFMRNVESAVMMAPALSTHAMRRESDYYSCIDDMVEAGLAAGLSGSAITGNIDCSSFTAYEYAAIDLGVLEENLTMVENGDGRTGEAAAAFIRAMALETPKTMQSRFAASVFPDMIMVEVLDDYSQAYSYCGAFDPPVRSYGDNPEIRKNSVAVLTKHADMLDRGDSERKVRRAFFCPEYAEEYHPVNAEVFDSIDSLLNKVKSWIEE